MNSTLTETEPAQGSKKLRDIFEPRINLLFAPSIRSAWLKQLTKPSRIVFDNWCSGSDEELMKYVENADKQDGGEGLTMNAIGVAIELGFVAYDAKWHFTDMMWELADLMSKEGIDWEHLTRDQLLKWYRDPQALGQFFEKRIAGAWDAIHPDSTQFLTRLFGKVCRGTKHSDLRQLAHECGLTHDEALSILCAATLIGGVQCPGYNLWIPQLYMGFLIEHSRNEKGFE